MKPYDTYVLLQSIKILLEKGETDAVLELINRVLEVIEDN